MQAPGLIKFDRFGRSYHLSIKNAENLELLLELDEAHWVATGAPVDGLKCDLAFLNLVDTDSNGRIMCSEMRDAVRWLLKQLRDRSGVAEGRQTLALDAINTDEDEGARVLESARKMLASLEKPDAAEITLDEVRQIKAKIESTPVSEGGVVLPDASDDDEVKKFIADVIDTVGGAPHPSGAQGVGQAQLGQFLADAKALLDWQAQAVLPDGETRSDIMPFGADTSAAFALLSSLRGKIDQYFAQCDAVALEPRIAEQVYPRDAELRSADFADPEVIDKMLEHAPLAKPTAEHVLCFTEPINPRFAPQIEKLQAEVIKPVLGGSVKVLTEDQWEQVKAAFAAHEAWVNAKAGAAVEKLGGEAARKYLDERFARAVRSLIGTKSKTAFVLDNIRLAEKLILYQAWLLALANNFVSFPHLYDQNRRAMFETGTLIMDGRRFNLAVKVEDRAQHSATAKSSNMFVLYVEVVPAGEGRPKYEAAVPVTSGGKGNLCVGKRGVFEDVDRVLHDAKVVQIIENPISVTEALASPFQRLGGLVTSKIGGLTAEAEKKLDAAGTSTLAAVTAAPKEPAATAAPAAASGPGAGNLLMGGSIAVAALGSAAAFITKTLAGLKWYTVIGGLVGAVLAVMVPISIVALMKLRRRDLSAILEGSGWAINARMRLTMSQARFFTRRPRYPVGAVGVYRPAWPLLVVIVVVAVVLVVGLWLRHAG
ncbi:MAG: hypothetical protein ABIF82_08840 [Planctomycetota bacterium]